MFTLSGLRRQNSARHAGGKREQRTGGCACCVYTMRPSCSGEIFSTSLYVMHPSFRSRADIANRISTSIGVSCVYFCDSSSS